MPTPRTRLGDWGEALAEDFLRKKGYRVLAAKYRCAWGELDIVARDGKEVVFVEVRTRRSSSYGAPEESLTAAKKARLVAASNDYLQRHVKKDTSWRIDLVSIHLDPGGGQDRIEHLKHAVEL